MPKKNRFKRSINRNRIKRSNRKKHSKRSNRVKRSKRKKVGGFQKKMGEKYDILSAHADDCGACMLNYFGAPQKLLDEMILESDYDDITGNKGITNAFVIKSIKETLNNTDTIKRMYPGGIQCQQVSYPHYEDGRLKAWRNLLDMEQALNSLYDDIKPGYSRMAMMHRPKDGATPSDSIWDLSGYSHWITLGKTEDGIPLLLDTQETEIVDGNRQPKTYRGFREISDYLTKEEAHGISVIDCYWSPDGTSNHPERVDYVEGDGTLGSHPDEEYAPVKAVKNYPRSVKVNISDSEKMRKEMEEIAKKMGIKLPGVTRSPVCPGPGCFQPLSLVSLNPQTKLPSTIQPRASQMNPMSIEQLLHPK